MRPEHDPRWTASSSNLPRNSKALWGSAANDLWVVGSGGSAFRWNGSAWAAVDTGVDADLAAVWGSAADDVWSVGVGGALLERPSCIGTAPRGPRNGGTLPSAPCTESGARAGRTSGRWAAMTGPRAPSLTSTEPRGPTSPTLSAYRSSASRGPAALAFGWSARTARFFAAEPSSTSAARTGVVRVDCRQ
jgi:hypothetical protein